MALKPGGFWHSRRSLTVRTDRGGQDGGVGLRIIRDRVSRFNVVDLMFC